MLANKNTPNMGQRIAPTYVPMANTIEDVNDMPNSGQNSGPSLVEKFGHYTVVSASMNLLISFLKKQLYFLSTREESKFGPIVPWSTKLIDQVDAQRETLRQCIEDVAYDAPSSGASRVLGCRIKASKTGEQYCYCRWYSAQNRVSDEIVDEHTITLVQARTNNLLDQICFRLNNLIYRLDKNGNCEFDCEIKDDFNKIYTFFNECLKESEPLIQTVENLKPMRQEAFRTNGGRTAYRTPQRNSTSRKDIPAAPQKPSPSPRATASMTPRKLDMDEAGKPVDEASKPVPRTSFPVVPVVISNNFSYASALKNTVPKDNTQTNDVVNVVVEGEANCVEEPCDQPMTESENKTEQTVTSPGSASPGSTSPTKGKKRSSRKKRKSEAKAQNKTDNCSDKQSCETAEVKESCETAEVKEPPNDEMVEVEMNMVLDGKSVTVKTLMPKSQLSKMAL